MNESLSKNGLVPSLQKSGTKLAEALEASGYLKQDAWILEVPVAYFIAFDRYAVHHIQCDTLLEAKICDGCLVLHEVEFCPFLDRRQDQVSQRKTQAVDGYLTTPKFSSIHPKAIPQFLLVRESLPKLFLCKYNFWSVVFPTVLLVFLNSEIRIACESSASCG
jgi:hypothetical protein